MYNSFNIAFLEKAFLKLGNEINNNLVTNIICFGDSLIELEAGKTLASQLNNSFCKTIKFKENPEFEDLIKQLNLISNQLDYIYSKPKWYKFLKKGIHRCIFFRITVDICPSDQIKKEIVLFSK